jgi:hypothetical protein
VVLGRSRAAHKSLSVQFQDRAGCTPNDANWNNCFQRCR